MASTICRSSATRTSASTSISTSRSTTFSLITTTLPGSVVTSLIPVCSTVANSSTCTTSTDVNTLPGSTLVSSVPVVITVTVPYVDQVTLWGSSCTTIPANPPPAPPPTTTTTTSVYVAHTPPTYTPPPPSPSTTIYTTSSVVTEDSTTYVTYFTTTAVSEPSWTPPPPSPSASAPTNTAAIIGGALGGVALLALLAFLAFIMAKKSNKFGNFFRRSNNSDQFDSSGKEPYQYGPVSTQSMGFSAPSSPERQPTALTDVRPFNFGSGFGGVDPSGTESGMQYGGTGNNVMFNVPNQAPSHHVRNPSLTPLLAGGAAVAGNRLQRPDTMSSSGRVSTASSDLAGSMVTHASPQQNVGYPPATYPSGLASYAQQHGFIPSDEQQQQQNFGHNRNGSVGSHTTMSSIPGAGSVGGNYAPFGAAGVRPGQYPQQQYMQNMPQRYEDPFTRIGSPESIPENPTVSQMQSTDHTTEISSTSSSRAFNTPGLRLVGGSSMSSLDGKGRPLRNPKAPIVHLDGGEYREAQPGLASIGLSHPPAYDVPQ